MITILHGDDSAKSREELNSLRTAAKGKEIRQLEGKTMSDADLIQALSSTSLFGGDTVVIIENLFSGLGKKLKRITELATIIQTQSQECDVILWEHKEIGKTALTGLGKSTVVRIFKLPTIIFQFLDSVKPHAARTLIPLYSELLKYEPAELVHAMLLKRIFQLLAIQSGITPTGTAPWQASRLTNQAREFTLERLTLLYQNLREIEQKRNAGLAIFDLKESTELLLIQL